jgi:hypothetical protein
LLNPDIRISQPISGWFFAPFLNNYDFTFKV